MTVPTRDLLWRIAQHKYGWCYISRREIAKGDALVRRGLAEWGAHGRDHYACPELVATELGKAEIKRRWPISPFALGTYDEQPGGWHRPDGTQPFQEPAHAA